MASFDAVTILDYIASICCVMIRKFELGISGKKLLGPDLGHHSGILLLLLLLLFTAIEFSLGGSSPYISIK